MTRKEYIKKYSISAVAACEGTNQFPSVILAQALLEGGVGVVDPRREKLALEHHNHFGIKADAAWKGKKVLIATTENLAKKKVSISDYFRAYKDDVTGFLDRIAFLNGKRYAKALLADTPEKQVVEIKAAGYATDPFYVSKLMNLIKEYNLLQYDPKKKVQLSAK